MFENKFMKSAAFVFIASISLNVIADEIPASFRGQWGDSAKVCDPKAIESNNVVKISATKFDGYESSCKLKKSKSSADFLYEGVFICSVEGESSTDTIKLVLQDGGKSLLVKGNKLMKCR